MATVRASIAEAIGVSGDKIEELTARLADATEAASAEIFGEELPGERELIVEATMRNLANMIANNQWLDTPEKVEAYCNQVGMDLATYALGCARTRKFLTRGPRGCTLNGARFALGTGAR